MRDTLFDLASSLPASRADLSECGRYRWSLHRRWSAGPSVLWVMLNPSTADASIDDPTIRRCIGFSRAWGYGGLAVGNLFALRSPDPAALLSDPDPVGPRNDQTIADLAAAAGLVMAAWGAHSTAGPRARAVLGFLPGNLHCLGITKGGAPKHPLYVPGSATPQPFGRHPDA